MNTGTGETKTAYVTGESVGSETETGGEGEEEAAGAARETGDKGTQNGTEANRYGDTGRAEETLRRLGTDTENST